MPISRETLAGHVEELVARAVRHPAADVLRAIKQAAQAEPDETARGVLETICERARSARERGRGLVTDPGLVSFFVRAGSAFPGLRHVPAAFVEGVERVTRHEPLVVHTQDLLSGQAREGNTGSGVPALHLECVPGSGDCHVTVLLKGAASELLSSLWVLPPDSFPEGVGDRLVSLLADAGGRPCPPLVLGVGLGGTPDAAVVCSRRALLRPVGDRSPVAALERHETAWRNRLNETGVGPMGLGGSSTVLAVHVEAMERHAAFLSVGVSVACWSDARAAMLIDRSGNVHW